MQLQVLLVAGTHGNEINGIFLFDQWKKSPLLINTHGIKTYSVIGNPEAKKAGKRYIHKDLNRSFQEDSFLSINSSAGFSFGFLFFVKTICSTTTVSLFTMFIFLC